MYLHSIRGRGGEGGRSAIQRIRGLSKKPGGGPAGSRALALGVALVVLLLGFAVQGRAAWSDWSPAEDTDPSPGYIAGATQRRLAVDDEDVYEVYVTPAAAVSYAKVFFTKRAAGVWSFPIEVGRPLTITGVVSDPDVDVWRDRTGNTWVYVVWNEKRDLFIPGEILMTISPSGGDLGTWGTVFSVQSDFPLADARTPRVVAEATSAGVYAYVTYAHVDGGWGYRLWLAAVNTMGGVECRMKITNGNEYRDDLFPDLTVDRGLGDDRIKNIVYQRQPSGGFADIFAVKSTEALCPSGALTPNDVKDSDPTANRLTPSLAHADGKYLYVVWEDYQGPIPRVQFSRSSDLGNTWEMDQALPIALGSVGAREPTVAACGHCIIGVAYTNDLASGDGDIHFVWSENNAATWSGPTALTSGSMISSLPFLAADEIRDAPPEYRVIRLHLGWNDYDGTYSSPMYRQSIDDPAESGVVGKIIESQYPLTSGFGMALEPNKNAYIFGGWANGYLPPQDLYTTNILRITSVNAIENTLDHLEAESGKAWMPAVWWNDRAFVFWGLKTGGVISDCITIYIPTDPVDKVRTDCGATTASFKRYGASAVYDGIRYIYIFGGSTVVQEFSGYPYNPGVTTDILRIDTQTFDPLLPGASLQNLCLSSSLCLPAPLLHGAAVWVSGILGSADAAFIVRGAPVPHTADVKAREIIRFDPSPPGGVSIVSRIPTVSGWDNAKSLSGLGTAFTPEVAFDASGNALAVWRQLGASSPFPYDIMAKKWNAVTKVWDASGTTLDNLPGVAANPHVAAAGSVAFAVWQQFDGTYDSIYSSRWNGASWGAPTLVESLTGPARYPKVGVDASGNAIVVWQRYDDSIGRVFANRYSAGAWGTPVALDSGALLGALRPDLAVHSAGSPFAIWRQWDGVAGEHYSVYAKRFDGSTWGATASLESSVLNAREPRVAVDGNANGVATWVQWDSAKYRGYASRYASGAWSAPVIVDSNVPSNGDVSAPRVAGDGNGNAIVAMRQLVGSVTQLFANRYSGGSWQSAASLVTELHTYNSDLPRLAMNAGGQATLAWTESEGSRQAVWAARYDPASGWRTGFTVDYDGGTSGTSADPAVAMDASGNAFALFTQAQTVAPTSPRTLANRYDVGQDVESVPAWKISASYDAAAKRVFVFGGSFLCTPAVAEYVLPCPTTDYRAHDSIYRFNPDPASYAIALDPCQRLPSKREGTASVWRSLGSASLVVGGTRGIQTIAPPPGSSSER